MKKVKKKNLSRKVGCGGTAFFIDTKCKSIIIEPNVPKKTKTR